jgi:hypothetical protein
MALRVHFSPADLKFVAKRSVASESLTLASVRGGYAGDECSCILNSLSKNSAFPFKVLHPLGNHPPVSKPTLLAASKGTSFTKC